jgi:hypothetical protein
MAVINRTEYDTCIVCGEPIRHSIRFSSLGRLQARATSHVRQVRDPAKRCRYDHGPELGSMALVKFPGDT